MSEQEYGYDTHNMHFYTDETLTIEVDMSEVPREEIEKVLGGVPIVRCKDCKHWKKLMPEDPDGDERCMLTELYDGREPNDYCSYGERREDERS